MGQRTSEDTDGWVSSMDTAHHVLFGPLLRRYREAAGLTQEEMAERAELSPRAVNFLEHGKRRPQRDTVRRLADALRLSAAERATFMAAARRLPDAPARPADCPLVGRTAELALLERHLAGEGPPVLLLAGEPGIGKSRLLQEAAVRAAERGWRVLSGGCQGRSGQEPFAPLLQALQSHVQAQTPARLRADLQGCAWLVRLLPELADAPIEPLPSWTVAPAQERRLLFDAVGRFLANCAGPAGCLLVLDDLQWAGTDALDLLMALARLADRGPLRLIGAYRDTEWSTGRLLHSTLADLAQAGLGSQHQVTPLAPSEATALLQQMLADRDDAEPDEAVRTTAIDAHLRERLLRRTGGVPFFLMSCAQALLLRPAAEGDELPWDVAQGVRQRVAVLPTGAREVLGVAAVAGRATPYTLLAAVVPGSEDALLDALEAACQARLLEETGDEYRFVHDVIREVVEQELGTARRTVLHRRIGEALERLYGAEAAVHAVELAYHAVAAGRVHLERAVGYLLLAGDQAEQVFAHADAERHYRTALDLAALQGERAWEAEAMEKLGGVLRVVRRIDEALPLLDRAALLFHGAGDQEAEGRVVAQIGWVLHFAYKWQEGIARLQPVVARLEQQGLSRALALLYGPLTRLLNFSGRNVEALQAAERAVELARGLADEGLLAGAQMRRGTVLSALGHQEEGLRVLETAAVLAETAGDIFVLAAACFFSSLVLYERGELSASLRAATRAVEAAQRRGGLDQLLGGLMQQFAAVALTMGEWATLQTWIDDFGAVVRSLDVTGEARVLLSVIGGLLALYEGHWEEAARLLQHAAALPEWPRPERRVLDLQVALALKELVLGHAEAALARLGPLLRGAGGAAAGYPFPLTIVAQAHLALGQVGAAHDLTVQALQAGQQNRPLLAEALWLQGKVLIAQRDWAAARRSLDDAVALARQLPYPYTEARALAESATLPGLWCEPEQARERLVAALVIFRRLGAHKDVVQTDNALAALRGS